MIDFIRLLLLSLLFYYLCSLEKFANSFFSSIFTSSINNKNKTTMKTIYLGNISDKNQAEKLVTKLSGKTYMNFIVEYGTYAGNYPVSISTERPDTTVDELKDMVLFYLASEF